jgi:hypothetical protein
MQDTKQQEGKASQQQNDAVRMFHEFPSHIGSLNLMVKGLCYRVNIDISLTLKDVPASQVVRFFKQVPCQVTSRSLPEASPEDRCELTKRGTVGRLFGIFFVRIVFVPSIFVDKSRISTVGESHEGPLFSTWGIGRHIRPVADHPPNRKQTKYHKEASSSAQEGVLKYPFMTSAI